MAILGGLYKGQRFVDFVGVFEEGLQIRLNQVPQTSSERICVNSRLSAGEDDRCSTGIYYIDWVYSNDRCPLPSNKFMGKIWIRESGEKKDVVNLERFSGVRALVNEYEGSMWYFPAELRKAAEIYEATERFLVDRFGNPVSSHHGNAIFQVPLSAGLKAFREFGAKAVA